MFHIGTHNIGLGSYDDDFNRLISYKIDLLSIQINKYETQNPGWEILVYDKFWAKLDYLLVYVLGKFWLN